MMRKEQSRVTSCLKVAISSSNTVNVLTDSLHFHTVREEVLVNKTRNKCVVIFVSFVIRGYRK
jgi:hypothetical protein